jgi:hypothetical protein
MRSTFVLVYSPLMRILAGLEFSSRSTVLMDKASTALQPVLAKNITYVFSLIDEQEFNISAISSFDNACLLFRDALSSLTFSLNFLGLISTSEYSRKFLIVTTCCLMLGQRYFPCSVDMYDSYLVYRTDHMLPANTKDSNYDNLFQYS